MAKFEWPTGPDYFNQTNVGAIVRNVENGNITLGLKASGQHHLDISSTQGDRDLSTMVNYPALTMKDDVSSD